MKKSLPLLFLFFSSLLNNTFSQNLFPNPGQVFRDDVVPRIDILIPPDSLDIMLMPGNERSNYHWHATFIFNNGEILDTVGNIGFRIRGNTSRTSEKKSFKVSFNTYEQGRKWRGLEKLNINGEHNDPSVARSKICWDLLRQMEVPAPRSNHVELYINGQYFGLSINVEHIDEEFVQLRFGNNDGNLYKCLWPADLIYKGDDPDLYKESPFGRRTYDLRTNTDIDDYSDLAHFINVLNNVPTVALPCALEKVFNVDTYLKAIAFDVLSGNWDGPIFNKNNFYLYKNEATGKFEYIPYDLDNTIGIDWFGIDWSERNIYEWGSDFEPRPIYERLLAVPEYRNRYSYYLNRFLEEIYNEDALFPHVDSIKETITPYVMNDPLYPLDYGFTFEDFNNSYTTALDYDHTPFGIKEFISDRRAASLQQLELNNIAPIITEIENNFPNNLTDISITAKVEDDGAISNIETCYQVDGQSPVCTNIFDDGQHADGATGDGIYGAVIGALNGGATIEYYIKATDDNAKQSRQPFCGFRQILIGSTAPVPLVINEFMASNDNTFADEFGEYDDWIEIHSLSDVPIFLGNYYLSDNEGVPDKWQMPGVSIQPDEYLIFWADKDEDQGEFHTNFKLSASGEFVGIFNDASNNFALIDGHEFGEQTTDVALGRLPDATGPFQFVVATPGATNETLVSIFENNIYDLELIISPNPFSGELNVLLKNKNVGIKKAVIYDAVGKYVFEFSFSNKMKIKLNTAHLNNGFYFLKVTLENNETTTKKIILQR